MSKLMSALGVVLLFIGVALTLLGLVAPDNLPTAMQLQGFLQASINMIVGGILAVGLGGVIAALEKRTLADPVADMVEDDAVSEAAESAIGEVPTARTITRPTFSTPEEEPAKPPRGDFFRTRFSRPETRPDPAQPDTTPAATDSSKSVDDILEPPQTPPARESSSIASRLRFPGFGRSKDESAAAAAASAAAGGALLSPSVQQTIEALEQAKADLNKALGSGPSIAPMSQSTPSSQPPGGTFANRFPPLAAPPSPPSSASVFEPAEEASPAAAGKTEEPGLADAAPATEEAAATDLYVVEDKVIRGRPARILSDGTVEAETDEGWMRFENLEHLNEYLDATQPE